MARMTKKTKEKVACYIRLVLACVLCVLVISPVRNTVLSPFLPGAWLSHNSFRLAQMLLDNQHFPVESDFPPPDLTRDASLRVNLSDVDKFLYKDDPFGEYFRQFDILTTKAKTDPEAAEELALIENFKPVMSLKERAQLMFTMDVFMKACQKHGIMFFMFEGSLLGSYRHHGLVPWDDDIDIALNASEWQKIRQVLSNIPGFTLFAPPDSQWKFYLSNLPAFSDKPFKFPYLDLFFFTQRELYVWGITWGMKNHLMVLSKHLFPLTTVRWEMLQVPAPLCVQRMVEANYGGPTCMTPKYVHKTNKVKYGFQTGKIDCSRLHKYLPFVFRRPTSGGRMVVESRRVGSKELVNVTVAPVPDVCLED